MFEANIIPFIRRGRNWPVLVILALITTVLAIRIFLGFDWTDECLYVADAYRIAHGDTLFADIWTVDQLAALQYAPLVYLYELLTGGTTGLILFLRLMFLVIVIGSAVLFYKSIVDETGTTWSMIAVMPILFCCNPITFSYNNIRTMTYLQTCALIILAGKTKGRPQLLFYILAGFLFGLGVLAYPTSIITFPLFALWVLMKPIGKARHNWRALLSCFCGGILCITALLIFILINSSIDNLINNFQYMLPLKSNVEAAASTSYLFGLIDLYGSSSIAVMVVSCIVGIVHASSKRAKLTLASSIVFWILVLGVLALQLYRCLPQVGTVAIHNRVLFSLALIGLPLFFYCGLKWHWSLYMYVIGMFASYVVYRSSLHNGMLHHVHPYVLSAIALVVYYKASSNRFTTVFSKWCVERTAFSIALATSISLTIVASLAYVYRDSPLSTLDTRLSTGPAAGLYTTPAHAQKYEETITDIVSNVPQSGNVLFVKLLPFGYLCTNAKIACYTTWRLDLDKVKLDTYYSVNPERRPDFLYFVPEGYGEGSQNGNIMPDQFMQRYLPGLDYTTQKLESAIVVRVI